MDNWLWLLLSALILIDLYFTVIRTAMVNTRAPRLVNLEGQEPRRVEFTLNTLERPRLRATFRLMLGFTHFLTAATAGWIAYQVWGENLTLLGILGVFLLTMIILLSLEFLAERAPLHHSELWAVRLSPAARIMDILLSPLSTLMILLQGSSHLNQNSAHSMTEDELRSWVETEQPEGGLEKDERRMIYSIFQFGDTLCREIMVPRIDVLAFEVTIPIQQAIDELVKSGHSRVPVYEGSIDNVIGLLYAKDLLQPTDARSKPLEIRKLLRKAYFVPESKNVDELLSEMQGRGVHMAIVVDEYGGMAGLVTLEDIVEEIVGEIRDEYDQGEEAMIQKISDDEYIFRGQIALNDVNDTLNTQLTAELSDSLGGFVYSQLGRVPFEGDVLQVEEWQFTVEEVRGRRIGKIRAQKMIHKVQEEEHGSRTETKAD